MQILKVLLGLGKVNKNGNMAWSNHPAVLMWKGYEHALLDYIIEICREWTSRRYKDTVQEKSLKLWQQAGQSLLNRGYPWWLGNDEFHKCHRQTLLSKDLNHYKQFNWTEQPKYEYWWPVEKQ